MEFDNIQFYLAWNEDEYKKALEWVEKNGYNTNLKEVGMMPSTDLLGNPIEVWVFIFTAPNEVMKTLTNYMGVDDPIALWLQKRVVLHVLSLFR